MRNSYLSVTDQFCGAGGSSQGVRRLSQRLGGGIEVKMALNHWKLAIETHSTNFPDTLHDCTDISAADPRRYPSTDILITSPECTTHSPAGGNNHKTLRKQMNLFDSGRIDPATERSRATMWDVPRFAEYHKYIGIVVENVVEAKTRWPLFDTWLTAMHVLGYNHRLVFHNSMHHHPTPQSRDRMYIVFWRKGNRAPQLDFTPSAHCPKCLRDVNSVQTWKDKRKPWGKYRKQYVYCCPACSTVVEPYYYAAFNCIDWTIPGRRIGDGHLKPKTIRRIELGRKKFWNNQELAWPIMMKSEFRGKKVTESNSCAGFTSAMDALLTQTTCQNVGVLTPPPFIVENKGKSSARKIEMPLSTMTTNIHQGILATEPFQHYISYYYGTDNNTHITEPVNTFTTVDRAALVSYNMPELNDCYYRTLRASEVKIGMAFEDEYIVLGDVRAQVKQLGNAVTPPAMEWIVEQVVVSLS